MARHVITIPIIKSSNNSHPIYELEEVKKWGYPQRVSNSLYMSRYLFQVDGTTYSYYNLIGLGWDASSIVNKVIVSKKLFLYSKYNWQKTIVYGESDFVEGSHIPLISTSLGALAGAFTSGWNELDISKISGESVVIGSNTNGYSQPQPTWGEFYSHRNSVNKPYIEITYDDIPPENPNSLYPENITLNPRDVIKFSWLHNSPEELLQKSFILQYSINAGSTWTTVSQTTANQYYDMPASTLPTSGTVLWKVMTTDTNSAASGYTTASFTLGVVPQKAPIPVAPISQYMDQTKVIKFEWVFVGGSSGETQSKYDLQYSINGGTSWVTKTLTSANQYYELAANTLASGNVIWKVRTYNNWNEVSPYSENRSFTVIGSPPVPQITTITNSTKPLISWSSSGQHLYELQILKNNIVIIDTGSIPSTSDKEYKTTIYLDDGDYKARLRVMNEYSLYSPWGEKSFSIATIKPTKPIVDIYNNVYAVTLIATDPNKKYNVYRDGIHIGEMNFGSFDDYTGQNNKEYEYVARVVDENDNFNDSDPVVAKCSFGDNTLALMATPHEFIRLEYGLDSVPQKSGDYSSLGVLVNYDGRKYAVVEYSEFDGITKNLGFFIKTRFELDRIKELIGNKKTLIYRDNDGENIIGTILGLQYSKNILGYVIGFTINKTEV